MNFKPTPKLIEYYFYISAGGLGTAMEYINDMK